MNILFITDQDISPLSGGIERVVGVLASAFSQRGMSCFLAFAHHPKEELVTTTTGFTKKILLPSEGKYEVLKEFIQENRIEIVSSNVMGKDSLSTILPTVQRLKEDIPQLFHFFVYHNYPGYETSTFHLSVLMYRIFEKKEFTSYNVNELLIQLLLRILGKRTIQKWLKKKYETAYYHTDKIILLSESYIPLYSRLVGVFPNMEKFLSIGNPLSFADSLPTDKIRSKQKEVLIVARMEEKQKRILSALKIWKEVANRGVCSEWKLVILGTGEDESYYKQKSDEYGLKNICFEGRKDPIPYYERASIFMMTSAFEGFPMTLGEAQQMGVVPVAFDSFEAIHDIIKHRRNGLIVRNRDLVDYANKLIWLMQNEELRHSMAHHAIADSAKYNVSKVLEKWVTVFKQTRNKHNGHETPIHPL